jgi:hypothetical protein
MSVDASESTDTSQVPATVDISILNKSLPTSEKPGLDTLDPRFQNIATLVEGSDFAGAAAQTEALFREDIYDIRLFGYYLYGCFIQNGLAGFGDILDVAIRTFGENWPAFGPVKKKEQHAQNALFWFYTRVVKRMEMELEAKGPEFEKWKSGVDSEAAGKLLEKHEEWRKALGAVIPEPKAADLMKKFDDYLRQYQKLVYVEPPPSAPEPTPEAAPSAEAAPAESGAPAAAAPRATPGAPAMEGSPHLLALLDKLKAFEVVCEKGEFNRAAVIANDISQIVAAFDPRVYFPKMFSTYYQLLSKNIEQIAPALETKETPVWQALEQFYKVDPWAFANS